jgi:hypothetical protein
MILGQGRSVQELFSNHGRDAPASTPASIVEIAVGAVVIRVSSDLEEAALRRILRAVRSA